MERITRIAIKLYCHPSSDKLITLSKDANINDKQLFDMVKNINNNCKVCQKYKTSKPVVSFLLAENFNVRVALDLKEWKNNQKEWFLCITDFLTPFSASCVIKTKQKEEIIKTSF